ncbi:hypothetical protein JOC75_001130 [Metabacillus crassostreae]|uniref:hypothetical protein n=1 Tax=Metabacillus crassostreae TaxID=929098 RepID=UPI00195C8655|nr:hypothetical protein [Metabacillus crassostreae]MBM7603160.1 hypothetical protein [Metabacillus crassostreae]
MKDKNLIRFYKKIEQFEFETTSYIQEIKKLVSEAQHNNNVKIISYFTYSTNISHCKDKENLLIGTFHLQNIGNTVCTKPYICIKLKSDVPFHFSGKYISKKSNTALQPKETWERINNQTDPTEFWLMPVGKEIIAPSEKISFPNFQVKWTPEKTYSGGVMGYSYAEEFKDGIPAINQIHINGQMKD